ncbi:EF-P beta-lysylation protein EpmB [Motiliproteus sp. SC1-56]|uniref:EF-P beta-lysylation protein EpmB n=1 Tax=Motiliproteus sp. SC1-56 TaxID=2799565 RepID=UPI001A8C19B9|nr:EF-P beta-lysylation protein EpmB [Motiliproteus sp. SC1-56]
MIHRTGTAVQAESTQEPQIASWQAQLAAAALTPQQLAARLDLPATAVQDAAGAAGQFALRVPEAFLRRMQPGNPRDPLLLQVLPSAAELTPHPGYSADPLGETDSNPVQGLIHKYHGRVLLIASGGCAINCRYCFRRHFPYSDNQLGPEQWRQVMTYLAADPSIEEVILSGGDPLATPDARLGRMMDELQELPHLKRLRLHTRLPVVIPDRITPELLQRLAASPLQTVMVVHINHANELDAPLRSALAKIRETGTTLLNQTVLLRGINDGLAPLKQLSEQLFEAGVLPYYLHLLDPVAGAAHFAVTEDSARRLAGALADNLPGYLVPRLVCERAGASAKVPLTPILSENGA